MCYRPARRSPSKPQRSGKAIADFGHTTFVGHGYAAKAMKTAATTIGICGSTHRTRYASKKALLTAVTGNIVKGRATDAARQDHEPTDNIGQHLLDHGSIIAGCLDDGEEQASKPHLLVKGHSFPELDEALHRSGTQPIFDSIENELLAAGYRDRRRLASRSSFRGIREEMAEQLKAAEVEWAAAQLVP